MRKQLKEFVDSAAQTAYQLFWTAVFVLIGGAMTAAIVALLVYLWGPNAVWIYPYLYFATGFLSAWAVIISLVAVLNLVKRRRLKTSERLKLEQFKSSEKGVFGSFNK
jgi:hypothetical protein